jgi:hypothetical protein
VIEQVAGEEELVAWARSPRTKIQTRLLRVVLEEAKRRDTTCVLVGCRLLATDPQHGAAKQPQETRRSPPWLLRESCSWPSPLKGTSCVAPSVKGVSQSRQPLVPALCEKLTPIFSLLACAKNFIWYDADGEFEFGSAVGRLGGSPLLQHVGIRRNRICTVTGTVRRIASDESIESSGALGSSSSGAKDGVRVEFSSIWR